MSVKLNNIAVLIDADNASANNIGYILQKIETLGRITCKNIYGDWGNAHIKSWQNAMLKHAINPMQQFAYVTGKNTTDIGLVIDAMDMLYSEKYDGFCLISSDSDFTALALRIRKNHTKVFGFGKHITVDAFTQACDSFYYVEDLLPSVPEQIEPVITKTPKIVNALKTNKIIADNKNTQVSTKQDTSVATSLSNKGTSAAWDEKRLKCDTKLLNSLCASIINHPQADTQRWVSIGLVSSMMKEHYPDFKPQNYGYSKITNIIKEISLFETKVVNSAFYVRDKDNKKKLPTLTATVSDMPIAWTTKQLQTQTHLISVLNKLIVADPKSDKGWSNIAHIASQIKQSHVNIKLEKYGHPKFSSLVKTLAVHDIRTENSSVLIKIKTLKPTITVLVNTEAPLPKKASSSKLLISKTISPSSKIVNTNLKRLPEAQTSLAIYSSSSTNVILFCMNTQHENHSVEDVIHPNQKDSKDGSISLRQNRSNGIIKSNFICALNKQSKNIDQLVFIVTSKQNDISSDKTCPIIEVNINSWGKSISFSEKFNLHGKSGKNLLLFSLNKADSEWEFAPQNTIINGELQNLCRENGITLSNE